MLSGVLRRLGEIRQEANEGQITEPEDVQNALLKFEPLWEQLTTWEKERFIRALIAEVRYDGRTETVTVGRYRDAGFEIHHRGVLTASEWRQLNTTWSKRLCAEGRPVFYFVAAAIGTADYS
jgi:hypothetical protein